MWNNSYRAPTERWQKTLDFPKGCARRGNSEHCLNELQRWARAAVISADPRDGREMLRLLLQPPRSLCASTGHFHTSPPGSLCSSPLPGSRDPGTTSLGEHKVRLRLVQRHAGLCHRRLTPHPVPLPPPAWVSQSPLISCHFNPVLSGQEQMPSGDLHTEAGPIQSWTPGAGQTKKRKGNFSQQPQEQRIKSPQSTWCTLHLWNTWIDNESPQNWGGGLWEQL